LWDAAAMDAGVVVHLEGIDEVVGDDLPHQPDTRQPLDERRVVEVDIVRRDVDMCHAGIFVTGNLKAPPTPKSTSDHGRMGSQWTFSNGTNRSSTISGRSVRPVSARFRRSSG